VLFISATLCLLLLPVILPFMPKFKVCNSHGIIWCLQSVSCTYICRICGNSACERCLWCSGNMYKWNTKPNQQLLHIESIYQNKI
jgi:hypothetical protein